MCAGCWRLHGAPEIDTPAVREAARLVGLVYQHSVLGGNLHCIVDDYNLEDDQFSEASAQFMFGENVHEAGPEQLAVERQCFDALKALTVTERAAALALYDGYWSVAGAPPTA